MSWDLDFFQKYYLVGYLPFTCANICRFFKIFNIYVYKYVYFSVTICNHLGCLTSFKHRLNGLNAKQRVTDCLSLSFSIYDNIDPILDS